jgi:hypothetical protein
MARRHLRAALVLVVLAALAGSIGNANPAWAQGQGATATLTGQVTDQSGAAIPGVQLSLVSTAGGQPINTTTNETGYYRFSFLRPDTYTLTAKMKGFGDVTVPNITLNVNQTSNIDVTLKPGAVVQEITVSAAAVALETQSSSLGAVVGEQVNTQLPLILRDPTQLVNLVPGVTSDHRQTTAADSSGLSYQGRLDFEINGGYRSQAVAMVDGVDVTIVAGSFSSNPIIPGPDFTQEFKVQTNNLGPEFGRGTGVLNIVTKSGTNQLHGTAFEFIQNDNLNSQDLFSNRAGQKKAEAKRNQYGFALGGPVYIPNAYDGRDKTFWFFNWEQLRQRRALPVSLRVPNADERAGNFNGNYAQDGTKITLYNPFDTYVDPTTGRTLRRPFANNTVPQGMWLDPAFTQKVLGYFPNPNNPGIAGAGGVYTGLGNYQLAGSAPLNWDRFDIKLDHAIGSNHRLMGRYSQTHYQVTPLDVFGNAASSQSYSTRDNTQNGYNLVASWTWTASPSTVITQAIVWSRFIDDSNQPKFDPTQLGGPFASGAITDYLARYTGGGAFPNIGISPYATMGNGFGNNFKEPYSNYGYSAGINHTRGKHTLKFGFNFELLQAGDNLFKGFGGTFSFPGSWTCGPDPLNCSPNTGNGLADFQLGLVRSGSMNAAFASLYTSKYIAGYVQDDFRVTPKLTLNLGFRYEVTTPFTERFDHEFRFDPNRLNPIGSSVGPNTGGGTVDQVLAGLGNRPLQGVVTFPSSPGVQGRGMVPIDWTNLSPRLGLAYQINPKLVFRAGFSKLYMLSPATPGPSTPGNGTFGASTNITSTVDGVTNIVNGQPITIDNSFPFGFNVPTYDQLGLASLLGDGVTAGATGQKTPYTYQWNAGFQYELPGNSLLGISYAGSRGHRLTCAFFFCGDQIPRYLVQQYGSHVFDSVANPFYGIITNPRVALSSPTVLLGQLLKQWPAYANWTAVLPPWQGPNPDGDTFQSQFDALEVQYNKRFSQGLTLVLAYTFSKTLTNSDSFEAGYLGPAVGYQNTVDYKGEWSLSAADVNHRLVVGHVYDLPIGRGKALGGNMPSAADKILGHWQFAGMTTIQSGFPIGIGEAGHTTGAFGGGDRPNQIGAACLDTGRSRGEKILGYLNPAGFAAPAPYTFGNAPRMLNGCRMDGQKNFDLSLIKFIPIKEKFNAEFRAEFFNAFNRPQLGGPNTTFNGGSFGVITSQANAPRIIQFGLKLNF